MLFLAGFTFAAPAADPAATRAALLDMVDHAEDLGCLTPLLAALHEQWEGFTPAERARISAVLAPPGSEMFAPVQERPAVVPRKGAPPPARDSCWSWSDNRLVGDHFVVEWEDGVKESLAEQWLEDLEYSWEKEVDEHGWQAADGSDKYLLVAYIQNKRSGGAYTYIQSCGGSSIPYMVSGNDSWNDPDWGATMAAHEFNHMLQFSYGDAPEFWWWEATATWVEDYVFPDVNYWSSYVYGYTQAPWIAMSASDQQDQDIFYHMYGMAIFAFYLDNYQGGHDAIRATWEHAQSDRGRYDLSAEDMVVDLGLDWDAVYADFVSRNTVMDYDQQRLFPRVDLTDEVKELPANGKSASRSAPQGYGQNFVSFEKGMGTGDLVVHFEGDSRADWLVQLVESESKRVNRVVGGALKNGAGDVTLPDYGNEEVVLVVSPLTSSESDFEYSWTAELVAPAEEPGGDTGVAEEPGDLPGDGGNEGDGGVDAGTASCGCTNGGSAAGAAALLAAVALAARRRR
jgi:hypothetical protein